MATSTTRQPISPELVPRVRAGRVWRGAVLAAVAGVAAVEIYAAAVHALGVPMKAGFVGAATASPLTAASFATGVLVCTFWGAVLATVLTRMAARPARMFVTIAAVLTGVSLAVPFGAAATAPATKLALVGGHILVAGIVIPILARHLRPAPRAGT